MAQTIQIKRGSGSSVPSSLAEAELAINLDSGKLYYGSGSSVSSDFTFDSITAETYVISSSVTHMTTSFSSGSTAFGDSSADQHTFTGNITASGNISSSNNFYSKRAYFYDDESAYLASSTNPILHLKNTNVGGNADSYIKFESTDNGSHYSVGIDTNRNTFVIGSGSYLTQDVSPPFSIKDDKIAINVVTGIPSYTLDVGGDIRSTGTLRVDVIQPQTYGPFGTPTPYNSLTLSSSITASGHIQFAGNISGSHTTTASFGSLQLSNLPTTPTGLPTGSVWVSGSKNDSSTSNVNCGTLMIVI